MKDAWGNHVGKGAHSVNLVLCEADGPLTLDEIAAEVFRRGLPSRGAIYEHVSRMGKDWFYVVEVEGGWVRTDHGSEVAGVRKLGYNHPDGP